MLPVHCTIEKTIPVSKNIHLGGIVCPYMHGVCMFVYKCLYGVYVCVYMGYFNDDIWVRMVVYFYKSGILTGEVTV